MAGDPYDNVWNVDRRHIGDLNSASVSHSRTEDSCFCDDKGKGHRVYLHPAPLYAEGFCYHSPDAVLDYNALRIGPYNHRDEVNEDILGPDSGNAANKGWVNVFVHRDF